MRNSLLLLFATLILNVVSNIANGQLPLSSKPVYKQYSTENSNLTTNTLYNVVGGEDGYIWIASDFGLLKYNGATFQQIIKGDVIGLHKTSNDLLILLFYNGSTMGVNLKDHKVINTDSLWGLQQEKNNGRPFLISFEQNNKLFLIKSEFLHSTKKSWNNIYISNKKAFLNSDVSPLKHYLQQYIPKKAAEESDKLIWLNQKPLFRVFDSLIIVNNRIYKKEHGNVNANLLFDANTFPEKYNLSSCQIIGNDLWIGTLNKGLIIGRNYLSANISIESVLPFSISGIFKDKMENIWVSTLENGLIKFKANEMGIRQYPNDILGITNNNISSFKKITSDTIAFSYNRNESIQIWSSKKRLLKLSFNYPIYSIFESDHTIYLLGANISFLKFNNEKIKTQVFKLNTVFNSFNWKDIYFKDKSFYALSNSCYLQFGFDTIKENQISAKTINKTSFQKISKKDYLFGTSKGIYLNHTKLNWLPNSHFLKIRVIDNELYCCTLDGIYNISIPKLTDSLALKKLSPEIANEIKSEQNYIFFKTKEKLVIIDAKNKKLNKTFSFKSFTIPFSVTDFFIDSNYIAIAGSKGIFYFPKNYFLYKPSILAPAHLLNSLNNNQPSDSLYKCAYSKRLNVNFKVDVLDYSLSVKDIKYKITKNDEILYGWGIINANNIIQLNRPEPGEYKIEVEIKDNEHKWVKTIGYLLIIEPLWWQTWCADLLKWFVIILIISTITYLILKWTNKKKTDKIKEKLMTIELESQALFAQMKPHFIFNALIPFQDLTLKGDSKGALNYVNTFSRLMRGILRNSRIKNTSLKEEINFIENYLEVQKRLNNDCFDVIMHIDPELDIQHVSLPTMLIQPLIENAIEHGLNNLSYRGQVRLSITKQNNELIIIVSDNGKGYSLINTPQKDHAIYIIKERLFLLKKLTGIGMLKIESNNDEQGTRATITVPLVDLYFNK